MRTAPHAQMACDLQEKQETIQSQPEAIRSRAAYNEDELAIEHLMAAVRGRIPYLSVYSVSLRSVDPMNGR